MGIRSLPVKRYLVFYRVASDTLEIARVLSGYRDIETLF
ncbi:MAG: type II toxin-antitoxin system RelE/ParE family toxin [Planctomycetes bacterium]|nr:type II toxin-antitoxin system RelE/ParE family toxin [Planctomycetota bacterium]